MPLQKIKNAVFGMLFRCIYERPPFIRPRWEPGLAQGAAPRVVPSRIKHLHGALAYVKLMFYCFCETGSSRATRPCTRMTGTRRSAESLLASVQTDCKSCQVTPSMSLTLRTVLPHFHACLSLTRFRLKTCSAAK